MRTRTTLAFLCGFISFLIVSSPGAGDDPPNAQAAPDITDLERQTIPVTAPDHTPQDAGAQLLLARELVATGDDLSSLEHFRKAAELDPASEGAVLGGAAALVRLHQYARARPVLEAGLDRMPSSGAIAFALARLLAACPDAEVRDGERAYELAQQVYKVQPIPRHAQLVAQALAELDRCDEAAKWQQKVVDAATEDGATEVLTALRADLEVYRQGKPCRMPTR